MRLIERSSPSRSIVKVELLRLISWLTLMTCETLPRRSENSTSTCVIFELPAPSAWSWSLLNRPLSAPMVKSSRLLSIRVASVRSNHAWVGFAAKP